MFTGDIPGMMLNDSDNLSNDRWQFFLDGMLQENDPFMEELRSRAVSNHVPLIRRETEYFLRWLVALKAPTRILEIGTGTGYSAICMMRFAPTDATIITIEQSEKRADEASVNFKDSGFAGRISIINDDACNVLPKLDEDFDMIFLDAAKGQYLSFFPWLVKLISHKGILVCDNILQNGSILESRFAIRRRDRTIHKRMRDFLYELTHNSCLITDLLPIGDGIAISVKNQDYHE